MKEEEICLEPFNEIDVRWRLLNGKIASPETRPLLLQAVSMFHVSSACPSDCFIIFFISLGWKMVELLAFLLLMFI